MKSSILLTPLLVFALLCGGACQNHPTPEAVVYDTLKQASNALDLKMQLYGAEVRAGRVSVTKQAKVDAAYTKANNAIIAAAVVAKNGLDAETPEETAALVRAVVDLIVAIIPPPTSTAPATSNPH